MHCGLETNTQEFSILYIVRCIVNTLKTDMRMLQQDVRTGYLPRGVVQTLSSINPQGGSGDEGGSGREQETHC